MTSVKYDYNFLAGIYVDGELHFNSYTLNLHLYIRTLSQVDQQIAFNRMDHAIHEITTDSVFVDESDTDTIEKLTGVDINVITIPDPGPIDQILHMVLISKLNAITEDKIGIFESELSSSRGGWIRYVHYSSEELKEIEDGEMISNDPRKWWNDKTPRFVPLGETTDLFKQSNTWRDLDLHWEEEDDFEGETLINFTPEKPTNIVTITEFTEDK